MLKRDFKVKNQTKGMCESGISGTFLILIICSVIMGTLAGLKLQFTLPGVISLTSALSHLPESLPSGLAPEQEGWNGSGVMTLDPCSLM